MPAEEESFRETLPARASAFYEITRRMLDQQLGSVAALDNRLATASGLNAVIAALFAAAIAIPSREPPEALWILAIVVLGLFAAGAFCGYRAFSVRDWSVGIDPREAQVHAHQDVEFQWRLAANAMSDAYHQNIKRLARKDSWVRRAIALTTVNAVVVSVAAIIATIPW